MAWLVPGLGPEVKMEEGGVFVLGDEPLEPLGGGAYGIVYPCKVKLREDGGAKFVNAAVKCIMWRPDCEDLHENEYRIWKKASGHENVVELYGRKLVRGLFRALLVCELMEGDLIGLIKKSIELCKEEILSILVQIGKGLQHVHEKGLIHMDLKPGNILISRSNSGGTVVKITDFGCALAFKSGKKSATATFRGTQCFQAPEVVRALLMKSDKNRITPSTDVYSYGMTMCALFNGELPPFDSKSPGNKVKIHDCAGCYEIPCNAPLDICKVIEECLLFENPDDHTNGHGRPPIKEVMEKLESMRSQPESNQKAVVFLRVESAPEATDNHPAGGDEDSSPLERERMGLLEAAMHGDLGRVEDILEASPEYVNVEGRDSMTPLLMAAAFNRTENVLVLMNKGANPHHMSAQGYNALMLAASNGNTRIVEALIKAGVDCKKESQNKESALLLAAQTGQEEVCRILKAEGASLESKNINGRTTLHAAAARGHHEVVKFLLNEGVDPWTIDKDGDDPILSAAGFGHPQVISVIAENARAPDPEVQSASEPRATAKNRLLVKFLSMIVRKVVDCCSCCCCCFCYQMTRSQEEGLEEHLIPRNGSGAQGSAPQEEDDQGASSSRAPGEGSSVQQTDPQQSGGEGTTSPKTLGIDLDRENYSGSTALQEAARFGFAGTVNLLIKLGADVNKKGANDRAALHQAAINGHTEAARVLLDADAEVNLLMGTSLYTPLFLAVKYGHVDAAKLLLERGADKNATNSNGDTPLHKACLSGNIEIVKVLLESGAHIHTTNPYADTPLHEACLSGNIEIVKVLLESGAHINATNKHCDTPLHKACLSGNIEVVKLLLESGADINATNDNGDTPLHKARGSGNSKTVRMLLESGPIDAYSLNLCCDDGALIYSGGSAVWQGSKSFVVKGRIERKDGSFIPVAIKHTRVGSKEIADKRKKDVAYLTHICNPNLVRYYDCIVVDEGVKGEEFSIVTVMELMECSLLDLFFGDAKFADNVTFRDLINIFIRVAKGIEGIHEEGAVHFHLKTASILASKSGCEVKIGDYADSKFISDAKESVSSASKVDRKYGAPEILFKGEIQYESNQYSEPGVKQESDIYSLGCVMWECLNFCKLGDKPAEPHLSGHKVCFHNIGKGTMVHCNGPEPLCKLIGNCLKFSENGIQIRDQGRPTAGEIVERLEEMLKEKWARCKIKTYKKAMKNSKGKWYSDLANWFTGK